MSDQQSAGASPLHENRLIGEAYHDQGTIMAHEAGRTPGVSALGFRVRGYRVSVWGP